MYGLQGAVGHVDRGSGGEQPGSWYVLATGGRWSHWLCVQAQVMVATAPMCWGMTLAAHLVVIMGTQYYDGAHSQGADDYPVTDLLQMMGRASRPDIDDSGKSVALAPFSSSVC